MMTELHAADQCVDAAEIPDGRPAVRALRIVQDRIVDATAIVAGIAEKTRILAGNKPVSVELTAPALPVMVTTNPRVLRQVIMRLASSALRSTERGRIAFAVKVIGSTPEIVITDTGSGCRPEPHADLASAMDRSGAAGPRVDDANVPGLIASSDLARLIGGSISMRSVYGRGAMFTLTLPLRATERRRDLYAVE